MIKRACSYTAAIKTPVNPNQYSKILITFSQNQQVLITKTQNDLDLNEAGFVVQLSQSETLKFSPSKRSVMGRRTGEPAYMQVRAYASEYDAPGSKHFEIDVLDTQSEEVLSDG